MGHYVHLPLMRLIWFFEGWGIEKWIDGTRQIELCNLDKIAIEIDLWRVFEFVSDIGIVHWSLVCMYLCSGH